LRVVTSRLVFRILLLAPAVALLIPAIPRLYSGTAVEAAFPVPVYMAMDVVLPHAAYEGAARALSHAAAQDGEARIAQAEAAALAGHPAAEIAALLQAGLTRAPMSVRGWTLLAELPPTGPAPRRQALRNAIALGPYEVSLSGRRVRRAALLWEEMTPEAREATLRQARLLWREPALRGQIRPLLRAPGGAVLLTRAFAQDPASLAALNRWAVRDRLRERLGASGLRP
jgi:hypothetical protein